MKKFRFLASILILGMALCFIGCGGGGSDDFSDVPQSEILSSVTRKVVNGVLDVPPTPSGMKIALEDNSLPEDTEVSVIEKQFDEKPSTWLANSDRIFKVSAVTSNKGYSKSVDVLEKPMVVIVPNTIKDSRLSYYAGVRESSNSPWKFSRIDSSNDKNNPQFLSSVRASGNSDSFYFVTNKMGFEIALFAADSSDSEFNNLSRLDGLDFTIMAQNATDTNKSGYIDIKDGVYATNLNAKMVLKGNNLSSLLASDYSLMLSFINKSYKQPNKRIFGNSAQILDAEESVTSSDGYLHKVMINDYKLEGNEITFALNTRDFSITEFPQNFILTLSDKGNNEKILPFEYSQFVELKNSYIPPAPKEEPKEEPKEDPKEEPKEDPEPDPDPAKLAMPRNLMLSHTKISTQGSVTISWDSGNPAIEGMTYDVMVAFGDASETAVVSGISETTYKFSGKDQPLEIGNYSVRVIARSSDGASLSTGKVYFATVDITLAEPVIEKLKDFYVAGEEFSVKWSTVSDPLGVPVVYSVWIWNEKEEVHSSPDYMGYEPEYHVSGIATGSYKVKVLATNGSNEVEAGSIETFVVIAPSIAVLSIDKSFIADNGLYSRDTIIKVVFSENNFVEATAKDSVSVEGMDPSKIEKTFANNIMTVKFIESLEPNHKYVVSMSPVKDSFGLDIRPFDSFIFETFVFDGKGTESEPYVWYEKPYPTDYIPEDLIALIGSVSVDIYDIKSAFKGVQICDSASIINNGETRWDAISPVLENDIMTLGIGNTAFWEPNESLLLKVRFSALHNGKTIWFETSEKALTVESGKQITVGLGTEVKPYQVYTKEQLDRVRDSLDSNYCQMRDIDLAGFDSEGNEGNGWMPIGEYNEDGSSDVFCGSFDGCNHIISNMKIVSDKFCSGLFGATSGQSERNFMAVSIKNIILKDYSIESSYEVPDLENNPGCGGIIGKAFNNTQVLNCVANGSINAKVGCVGGIVGSMEGLNYSCLFRNCSFEGTIAFRNDLCHSGYDVIGGCVGYAYYVNISDCNAKIAIEESTEYPDDFYDYYSKAIGGMVGRHEYGYISNSHVVAEDLTGYCYAGGFVGYFDSVDIDNSDVEFKRIYATNCDCGGFAGCGYGCLNNCYSKGLSVEAVVGAGGFISNSGCDIKNCYADITEYVKTTTEDRQSGSTGGFIARSSGSLYDCFAKVGSIEGSAEFAGGFAGSITLGYEFPVIVDNCRCEINNLNSRSWSGGFAGDISYGIAGYVSNCQAVVNGDITVTEMPPWDSYYLPFSRTGGFVGSVGYVVIINCSAKFNRLSGTGTYVGGFVGEAEGANISNCYAEGESVSGGQATGGLVGSCSARIDSCYSTCSVESSSSDTGQIVGYLYGLGEITNCFVLNKSPYLPLGDRILGTFENNISDQNGYNSSLGWDSSSWDLSGTSVPLLPALKYRDSINIDDFPRVEY